jgi:O-antigen/teichoic acid export membrane protein
VNLDSSIKSFFSDIVLYALFNVINKAIPFILLPFITRMISISEYGEYAIYLNIENLLLPIVSLNIHVALSSHYYEDEFKRNEYLSTILFSILFFIFFFLLTSLILPSKIFGAIDNTRNIVLIAIFCAGLMSVFSMVSNLFRLMRKPILYGIYSICQSLLMLGLIIGFLIYQNHLNSLLSGRIFFVIIFFVITIVILRKNQLLGLSLNMEYFNRAFSFALPTVVYSISAFIFLSSDRFLIDYFLGKVEVGRYSAIFQLASVVSVLGMSLNAAWMPWLFENLKKNQESINLKIVKFTYLLSAAFIIIGIVYCLFFKYLSSWVLPSQYNSNINFVYPLILSYVFEAMYLLVSPYVFYKSLTKYNAIIGLFVAILNVALNIYLIPRIGISGAAYTTLATWAVLAATFFIVSYKNYPMPWFYHLKSPKNVRTN